MQNPEEPDLFPIDHEIERTFRNHRRVQHQARRMADNKNQPQHQVQLHEQIPQPNQPRAIQNKAPILVGDYVDPIPTPVQPAVVYPPFE